MRSAKFGHGTNSNFIVMPVLRLEILRQLDQRIGRIPGRPAQRELARLGAAGLAQRQDTDTRQQAGNLRESLHPLSSLSSRGSLPLFSSLFSNPQFTKHDKTLVMHCTIDGDELA